jgi:hypothetical protein
MSKGRYGKNRSEVRTGPTREDTLFSFYTRIDPATFRQG